mgnify:CR=1 FL=1
MRPFSLIFWAVLCVLSGIVLLIRQFTPLTFQPFKVIVGLFILLLGVSLLITPSAPRGSGGGDTTLFGRGGVSYTAGGEHNCIFGQSTVDLTQLPPGSSMEVNCVFGQCDVKLPSGHPVTLTASAAFGSVSGSGMDSVSFGERELSYPGEGEPIRLKVNAVFGQITLAR